MLSKKALVGICILANTCLLANSVPSQTTTVLDYNKKTIEKNKSYQLVSQDVKKEEPLGEKSDWVAYTLDLEVLDKTSNKTIKTPYFLFSNGQFITTSMVDMKTGILYGAEIIRKAQEEKMQSQNKERADFENSFILDSKHYTDDRLIAGNKNAKTKVVVFSDPLCVYCIKMAPQIIEDIKARDDIALYYFNFPLDSIHPTSRVVMQAIELAKKQGVKDAEYLVYKANLEKFYDVYRTTDSKIALDAVNKILSTKIKIDELEKDADINARLQEDIMIALGAKIQGTPAVLFNGSYIQSREKLTQFLKGGKDVK